MSINKIILKEFSYYGQAVSIDQIQGWSEEMQNLDEVEVEKAYKELRKRPQIGRPSVPFPSEVYAVYFNFPSSDEAFTMIPRSEDDSVVWCEEIRIAYGVCKDLLKRDEVAARMAFKKAYESEIIKSIHRGVKPVWEPSLGFKKDNLDKVLRQAHIRGFLPEKTVRAWSPEIALPAPEVLQIEGVKETFTPEIAEENLIILKNLFKPKEPTDV